MLKLFHIPLDKWQVKFLNAKHPKRANDGYVHKPLLAENFRHKHYTSSTTGKLSELRRPGIYFRRDKQEWLVIVAALGNQHTIKRKG